MVTFGLAAAVATGLRGVVRWFDSPAHFWRSRGRLALVVLATLVWAPISVAAEAPNLSAEEAARFAVLALECVHQEYPNKIAHVLAGDDDVLPPRQLTPAFFGCYDWHSSVHGHWLLARLARRFPQADFSTEAKRKLAISLSGDNVAAERIYLAGPGRVSFERPYGLAWLLQLAAELRQWQEDEPRRWSAALEPLESYAAGRIADWLPKLDYPIRTGEHSQTAFAFGLILDWARVAGNDELEKLLVKRVLELYGDDRGCPLGYEPSGQDFLSPCLAEADLMRRVMRPEVFAGWLSLFLPEVPASAGGGWLPPARVSDRSDPKLAHLDGLNLSRAWMLEGVAAGLPANDARVRALLDAAAAHAKAALPAVTGEHYEGGHWLGSFATYLVTQRGLSTDSR